MYECMHVRRLTHIENDDSTDAKRYQKVDDEDRGSAETNVSDF
jgi:hypothetical protein